MAPARRSNGTLKGIAAILGAIATLVAALGGPKLLGEKADRESPKKPPVEFTLYDRLNSNEVSKYLSISIDGKPAGSLTLDKAHPSAALKLSVPKAGAHSYSLEGILTVRRFLGRAEQLKGSGQAAIDVTHGKTFEPRVTVQGKMAHLSLHPATGVE